MKSRPILFSGSMVRAILDGSKTQTRRIVKPQSAILTPQMCKNMGVSPLPEKSAPVIDCPYGQPGDQLWVRETWMDLRDVEGAVGDAMYRATFGNVPKDGRWKPSIHMPRWASRITLEITGIRVERLREISEADAEAEGVGFLFNGSPLDPRPDRHQGCFQLLWEHINGLGSWDSNPWVWVVEFKRIEGGAK